MKISKNDPRITAYVLNELSTKEKNEFEKLLENDDQLKTYIEELKAASITLQGHLTDQATHTLNAEQREKVLSLTERRKRNFFSWPILVSGGGLVAASLALVLVVRVMDDASAPERLLPQSPKTAKQQPLPREVPSEVAVTQESRPREKLRSVPASAGSISKETSAVSEGRGVSQGKLTSLAAGGTAEVARTQESSRYIPPSIAARFLVWPQEVHLDMQRRIVQSIRHRFAACIRMSAIKEVKYTEKINYKIAASEKSTPPLKVERISQSPVLSENPGLADCFHKELLKMPWVSPAVDHVYNYELAVDIVSK